MINDVEYSEEPPIEDYVVEPVNTTALVDVHTIRLESTDLTDRDEQILNLMYSVQKYCRKTSVPIFNHPNTIDILMNLFG
jgi:hypothetical protein